MENLPVTDEVKQDQPGAPVQQQNPEQVLIEVGFDPTVKIYVFNMTFPQRGNVRVNMNIQEIRNFRDTIAKVIDASTQN